jgi:hypothetical protein
LVFDAAGNLYSTTPLGGDTTACTSFAEPHGCGVMFRLTPTLGWSETVLRKFLGLGESPDAFILYQKGNLYGTTSSSTGNYAVVFEIAP